MHKTVLFCNQYQNQHCIKKNADQPIKSVLSPRYWRFNEEMRTMDPGYPKPITIWRGVPDSPQGAFVDKANGTSCPVPPHSDLAEPAVCGLVCQPAVIDPATGQPLQTGRRFPSAVVSIRARPSYRGQTRRCGGGWLRCL